MRFLPGLSAAILFTLVPGRALAEYTPTTLTVDLGFSGSLNDVVGNAVKTLGLVAIFVCATLFLIGAVYMIASLGKEDRLSTGKELMIKSMIGLAVVGGAYAFIRTLYYIIYS